MRLWTLQLNERWDLQLIFTRQLTAWEISSTTLHGSTWILLRTILYYKKPIGMEAFQVNEKKCGSTPAFKLGGKIVYVSLNRNIWACIERSMVKSTVSSGQVQCLLTKCLLKSQDVVSLHSIKNFIPPIQSFTAISSECMPKSGINVAFGFVTIVSSDKLACKKSVAIPWEKFDQMGDQVTDKDWPCLPKFNYYLEFL